MKHSLFSIALSLIAVLPGAPVWAETTEERATRCAAQAAVVTKAVELRLENKREKRAGKILKKDKDLAAADEHIALLVTWVYQLPQEQLGDQTSFAFETACNQFDG